MPVSCSDAPETFPPISALLPHTGDAVLVDTVLRDTPEWTEVGVCITASHPFFEAGRGVPVWVGIEMMAQAAGVHAGLAGRRENRAPRRGMLLGTRAYEAHAAYFTEGMQLVVRAERQFQGSGGIAACVCSIRHAGTLLAHAALTILEEVE